MCHQRYHRMPKTLNVEKLEKKFASLTRSRESIQGLSSWIMHHKEFCQDIANEWLNSLKKDFNALIMFYVANDVIQHCGKKKVPEFRTAFSMVLEKALSLSKVKEIKSEVIRILSLWREREIYEDDFFTRLENKLNCPASDSEDSDVEEDFPDSEAIANFKLQNLINSVENLKKVADEVTKKEKKVKGMKEPEMPNIDNLIVKMDRRDSQKEYKRVDIYCKYLEDLIKSFSTLDNARNDVLKNLSYTNVFYTTQNEEVKKVAHAYRIYGKKLKIMEKSLCEKMSELRELYPSPPQESAAYDPLVEFESPINSPEDSFKKDSLTNAKSSNNSLTPNIEESDQIEVVSPVINKGDSKEKEASPDLDAIRNFEDNTDINIKEASSSPPVVDGDNLFDQSDNLVLDETLHVSDPFESDSKILEAVEPETVEDKPAENVIKMLDDVSVKSKVKEGSSEGFMTEVDFLLEKAYDDRLNKSKINFKRKIETLLKSKGNKTCKLSNEDATSGTSLPSKSQNSVEEENSENKTEGTTNVLQTNVIDAKCDKLTELPSKANESKNKDTIVENLDLNNKNESNSTLEQTDCPSVCMPPPDVISDSTNNCTKIDLPIPKSFLDIPVELLKNILSKNNLNMLDASQSSSEKDAVVLQSSPNSTSKKIPSLQNVEPHNNAEGNVKEQNSSNISADSCSTCDTKDVLTSIKEENLSPSSFQHNKELLSDKIKDDSSKILTIPLSKDGMMEETEKNISSEFSNILKSETSNGIVPDFFETLQDALQYISLNKFSSGNTTNSKSPLPCDSSNMCFENVFKLYSVILQCQLPDCALDATEHSKSNVVSNIVNNSMDSYTTNSSKSAINSAHDSYCDSSNSQLPVFSRTVTQNSLNDKSFHSSEGDNLEIMDMDVDSEDETTT